MSVIVDICNSNMLGYIRKILVVLLSVILVSDTVLLPNGELHHIGMVYEHCKDEDPDMNMAEFVLVHLMRMPDIFECMEHESAELKQQEHERPHQPIVKSNINTTYCFQVTAMPLLLYQPIHYFSKRDQYPINQQQFLSFDYLSDILRPPIVRCIKLV